jgi:alpha-tubulin suppressor-like RCC1 family protein
MPDYSNFEKIMSNEFIIVRKPTAIWFPKFVRPIVCVAAGAMHALVLTLDYEMYSWGEGSKGTLGFGNRENKSYPEKLEI